jgi:hypothetical protein
MRAPLETVTERVLRAPSEFSSYPTQSRHLDSAMVWSLCSAPAIVNKLVELAGPDLMVWSSFLFDKGGTRPELDGEIPWHQDYWFWGYETISNLSAWLALTPATEANGCVELVPGSHLQRLEHVRTGRPDAAAWFGGYEAEFDGRPGVPMILEPGQFFIFTEQTLHRSRPNLSGQRRVGLSIRVARPSQTSNRAEPCVLLHGQDRFGLNRFREPPIAEPDLAPALEKLQMSDAPRIEGPWLGTGWHAAEQAAGRWIRWTGPDRISRVDLRWLGSGGGRFSCVITHAALPDLLRGVRVRVNDTPLELSWRAAEAGTSLSAQVSATVLSAGRGRARVELELPFVMTPDRAGPDSTEARSLGIAIAELSITPD